MKTIILDTNFIVQCLANKVDIFSELTRICDFKYSLIILDTSLGELDKVAKSGKPDEKLAAKLAKQLIAKEMIKVKKTKGGHTDKLILQIAGKAPADTVVATQDKLLKQKLKKKKIPVIVLRKGQFFELQGA